MNRPHEHQPGEVWKHRTRDRTVRVLRHEVQTDNVEVETVGRTPVKRSPIYGYNLRQQYARVDDSGVVGPMVGAEPAALRLWRALDYRTVRDVAPVAPAQVAVVLHSLADQSALVAALDHERDPGGYQPEATSVGRWLHDVGDQIALMPPTADRGYTAAEIALAVDVLAMSQSVDVPESYWTTDPRIRNALAVLGVDPEGAYAVDWTAQDRRDPTLPADPDDA